MKYEVQCNKFDDTIIEPAVEAVPAKKKFGIFPGSPAIPGKPAVTQLSCRFYVLALDDETGVRNGRRWKVHIDGPVDFGAVASAFAAQEGCPKVSVKEIAEAYA